MYYQFCNLKHVSKLYTEYFTGKNAPYSGRKSEVDEIKIMTQPHTCKRTQKLL